MKRTARNWRVMMGGVAAGSAAVIGFAGSTASAEPVPPAPPVPAPVTVTQTVTVTPPASSAAPAPSTSPAPEGAPAAPETPAPTAAPATSAAPAAGADTAAAQTSAAATAAAAAPTPVLPPLPPATSGTIQEFLKEKGVTLEPQKAAGFTALNVVLPVPPGWSVVPDPNVPDAFAVIADRKGGDGLYTSNAQVQVYKLVGEFDSREAISHGFVDSQKLRVWQPTSVSMAPFGGFPSSVISGTYRDNDITVNTTRRYVVAESGADRYLVSMSVSTAANQAVAAATATEAILGGFRVTVPTPTPAPAAPAPAEPAPPGAPVAPPPAAALAAPAAPPAAAPVTPLAAAVPPVPAAPVPAAPPAPAPVPPPAG